MRKREFQWDIQRPAGSNILRLHRHIRSYDPAYKPPPGCAARRQAAAARKVRKWKR